MRPTGRRGPPALAVFIALLTAAAPACAQTPGPAAGSAGAPRADGLVAPRSPDRPPPGYRLTATRALAIASAVERVARARAAHPDAVGTAYLKPPGRWQVSYVTTRRKEVAQVLVADRSGRVLEAWTGYQVAWTMARGYPGAFGRRVNAWWVWVPLCVLFVLPFVDVRRPRRLLHLDLLALVSFSASLAFFNRGEIDVSVPLAVPPLAYLLVRMLALGRRGAAPAPLRLLVPVRWLVIATVFLVGFRVALNVTDSNVIDVGFAGVIGADRITHGDALYGAFPAANAHGDTYGPVAYGAYVPAELAFPWSGRWDDLPAAHAAAIAFDLLTLLGLWLLGRRVRGPTLGVVLAYAWASFPFTLYALETNANDALVALLLVVALLVAASAPARGALLALAGLTKFAPLALAPLLAAHGGRRRAPAFLAALLGTVAIVLAPIVLGGDFGTFVDRTIGFQRDRGSPFSIWGLYDLDGLRVVAEVAAVALACGLALRPRRPDGDLVQLAALGAAVLIAVQLALDHWFYLYIVWFLPFTLLALLGRGCEPARA